MIINQNIERLSKSKAEIKWEQQGLDFPRKKNEKKKKIGVRTILRNSKSISPKQKMSSPKNKFSYNIDIFNPINENIKSVHFSK